MQIENTHEDMLYPQNQSLSQHSNVESTQRIPYQCRICLQSQIFGNVISPCKCNSFIHPACLQQWLNCKKCLNCEICLQPYQIKWTKLRSFSCEIFAQAYEKEECEIMKKVFSMLFFFVLSFFLILAFLLDMFKLRNGKNKFEIEFVFFSGIGLSFCFFLYFLIKILLDYCMRVQYKLEV